MKPENLDAVRKSFGIQASNFESETVNFSKKEYLDYMLQCIAPGREDTVLEIAAGTCVCGRSFAPLVQTVVCLDAVLSMLQVGKEEADKDQLNNMVFVKGYAEELPFLDNSFDIVFSRLAFHHFSDVEIVFSEMKRVLRPGGKLVMIDMEAAPEEQRETEDEIERLRDPSHVKNLSKAEMQSLFIENGLKLEKCETVRVTQKLGNWLALTETPEHVQEMITERMKADIDGRGLTGFSPYLADGRLCFDQRWGLLTGRKEGDIV